MRALACVATLTVMTTAGEPVRLAIDVRFDAQPIEGRLYAQEGPLDRSFRGWIGLLAAQEAAREANHATNREDAG